MKFPALWLVAALLAGILLAGHASLVPLAWGVIALVLIAGGLVLLWRRAMLAAWAAALLAWTSLGGLAASLERAAVPPDHVTALLAAGRLDSDTPLRWRGRLRSDPVRLPWGVRYELALEEVELAGQPVSVRGGLRVSYYFDSARSEPVPPLRAGDRIEALLRARPPRNFLNPGAFDARTHLARQQIHLLGTLRSMELLRKLEEAPPALGHRFARVRGHLLDRLDALYASAPHHAALLRTMLLGDYNFVNRDVSEAFQKTGSYHVLVISGMHVAALSAFLWWLARRLRLSLGFTVALIAAVLALFVAVVEDRPPIERAALMAAVVLAGQLLYRRVELMNVIAAAALLMLLATPSAAFDPSFQLSFLAVSMIAGLSLPLVDLTSAPYRRALQHLSDLTRDASHPPSAAQLRLDLRAAAAWLTPRLPRPLASRSAIALTAPLTGAIRLWEAFLISLGVQLGMLPVMAHYFHRVSLSGLLANLPAGLLSALMVTLGFLTFLADGLSEILGRAVAALNGLLSALLLGAVEILARWSWASYRIPSPPLWVTFGFYSVLAILSLLLLAGRRTRWLWALAAAVLLFAAFCATYPFAPRLATGKLEITVLDVGQGDSIFISFPHGRTMLLDGGGAYGAPRVGGVRTGPDIGEQVVSSFLWTRGLKRLDAVVLSHAHNDHLDGLHAILENFSVAEFWFARPAQTPAFRHLLERARARRVRLRQLRRGDSFQWDDVTGLVLWPEELSPASAPGNNDSLVFRLEHGRQAALLTGDIEKPVEEILVEREDPLRVGFLKLAHHASRTSTTAPFLERAAPLFAAASFGAGNPFGYPHAELLARLCQAGVRFLRTDLHGAITAATDGTALEVTSFVAPADAPAATVPCSAVSRANADAPAAPKARSADRGASGSRPRRARRSARPRAAAPPLSRTPRSAPVRFERMD